MYIASDQVAGTFEFARINLKIYLETGKVYKARLEPLRSVTLLYAENIKIN